MDWKKHAELEHEIKIQTDRIRVKEKLKEVLDWDVSNDEDVLVSHDGGSRIIINGDLMFYIEEDTLWVESPCVICNRFGTYYDRVVESWDSIYQILQVSPKHFECEEKEDKSWMKKLGKNLRNIFLKT